ncbi:MAG: DUF3592 domain-containing protein [Verrucomicrobiota bacterium]|jgi:hypothetical protein
MSLKDCMLVLLAITALVVPVCIILFWCFKRMGFSSTGLPYALFGLIGLLAFTYGARKFVLGWQSPHWLRTDGIIRSAKMTHEGGGRVGYTYGANVFYEYRVGGSNYTSTRVCFGDYTSGDAAHARNILARYQPDAKITVFYDPDKPERAVLETGVHGGMWLGLGIGALFLVFGAFGLSRERTNAGSA